MLASTYAAALVFRPKQPQRGGVGTVLGLK